MIVKHVRRIVRSARFLAFLIAGAAVLPDAESRSDDLPAGNPPRQIRESADADDPLPANAVLRLGSPRFRIHGWTRGMAFGSDDQTLVTAQDRGQVVIWELTSGRRRLEISTSPQHVQEMRLTPDRRAAVTTGFERDASGKNVLSARIWDLKTGKLQQLVVRPSGSDERFDLSPDGPTLVFREQNGTKITAIDLKSGFKTTNDAIPGVGTNVLVCSPDGQWLAVADHKGLYLWNWQSEENAEPIEIGRNRRIDALAFSPDGKLLLEGPETGHAEIVVRNVRTREVIRTLSNARKEHFSVSAIEMTRDNKLLVAPVWNGKRNIVHVWRLADGSLVREIDVAGMYRPRIALSHDAKWLALAGTGTAVKIWNLQDGKAVGAEFAGHDDWIRSVHLCSKGRVAVTSGAEADGTVRVWDTETGRQRRVISVLGWNEAAVSADGGLVGILDRENLTFCNIGSDGPVRQFSAGLAGPRGLLSFVAFSADGGRFLAWTADCKLSEWDVATGKLISRREFGPAELQAKKPGINQPIPYWELKAAFSRDVRRLAVTHEKKLTILDCGSGGELAKVTLEDRMPEAVIFSPEGDRIAISNRRIRVLDIPSGDEVLQVSLPNNGAGPLAFSSDGKTLAIATRSEERRVFIVDLMSGKEIDLAQGLPAPPTCISWSTDGKLLACGLSDGTGLVWRLEGADAK